MEVPNVLNFTLLRHRRGHQWTLSSIRFDVLRLPRNTTPYNPSRPLSQEFLRSWCYCGNRPIPSGGILNTGPPLPVYLGSQPPLNENTSGRPAHTHSRCNRSHSCPLLRGENDPPTHHFTLQPAHLPAHLLLRPLGLIPHNFLPASRSAIEQPPRNGSS